MTNRIDTTLTAAKANGRAILSPYVTIGYPDLSTSIDIATAMLDAGADMLEIGVPFSDPLADGPTVQRTSYLALENGVTVTSCLEAVSELRSRGITAPLAMMGYYNPFLHYGPEELIKDAASAGVDGLIVPDLPLEEATELQALCKDYKVRMIHFVALTSTDDRIAKICTVAEGFIYCVAVLGVTGARTMIRADVRDLVAKVRKHTEVPVLQGFGVSTREHIKEIRTYADGASVASAILDAVSKVPNKQAAQTASTFVRELLR